MDSFKSLLPRPLLKFIRPYYHGLTARAAGFYYGRPSGKMIVIGITGTVGKSTTAAMLAHILNGAGTRTGYITTVEFFDGQNININKHGLSMPNEILLQRQLRTMAKNKCQAAVIECTSEGLEQNRHLGINFDIALFTNLSRAHLDSHGSFGNYQAAKGKLFGALGKARKKSFFPRKIIGVNLDDAMSGYFLSFPADKKFGVSFGNVVARDADKVFNAGLVRMAPPAEFTIDGVPFVVDLLAEFNAKNAGLAASCAVMLGVDLAKSAELLKSFRGAPGRMEMVKNNLGFGVIVDYGCEPISIKSSLEAASLFPHNRLIHVFGCTGGHRDGSKRFIFGKTAAQFADYIIVTNDDVYGSDPAEIAANIEQGINSFKLRKPPYEIILDRRAAIAHALKIAQANDIVLITGKGSEQFLVLPGNKRIEWDDRDVAREELNKLTSASS